MSERYEEKTYGPADATEYSAAFDKVARSRRSVRIFTTDPVPEKVINQCIDLALRAPNSSNLQPWEFHWVRSPAMKQALVEACMGQPAAATAAELIVCVARTRTWDRNRRRMLEFLKAQDAKGMRVPHSALRYYEKDTVLYYQIGWLGLWGLAKRIFMTVRGLTRPVMRGPFSESEMRLWAVKSTSLACQNLMLGLRAYGYDTCPMEGADTLRIKRLLDLPRDADVVMTLGCGVRSGKGIYSPQERFERNWFVFEH